MTTKILLDAGPLSRICHPRTSIEITGWLFGHLQEGNSIIVSEIADYEVRRELLRANKRAGIKRLDNLRTTLDYLPISTAIMLRAAELWAEVRKRGTPTADPHALDADVILAAQAEQAEAIVATDNPKHLALFVEAKRWQQIS